MNNERPQIEPVAPGTTLEQLTQRTTGHHPHGAEAVSEALSTIPDQVAIALVGDVRDPAAFNHGIGRVMTAVEAGEMTVDEADEVLRGIASHEQFATRPMAEARKYVVGKGEAPDQERRLRNAVLMGGARGLTTPLEDVAATFELASRQIGHLKDKQNAPSQELEVNSRTQALAEIHPAFLYPYEQQALAELHRTEQTAFEATANVAPRTLSNHRRDHGRNPYPSLLHLGGLREKIEPAAVATPGFLENVKRAPADQKARLAAYVDNAEAPTGTMMAVKVEDVTPGHRHVTDDQLVFPASSEGRALTEERLDKVVAQFGETHDYFNNKREGLVDARQRMMLEGLSNKEIQERLGRQSKLAMVALKALALRDIAIAHTSGINHKTDPETGATAERKWPKKIAKIAGGLAVAGGLAALLYQGMHVSDPDDFMAQPLPESTSSPSHNRANDPLANHPQEHISTPEKHVRRISRGGRQIAAGETLEHQLGQLGIPEKKLDRLTHDKKLGKTLISEGDAYRVPGGYELRQGDGRMSNKSIRAAYKAADMPDRAEATLVDDRGDHLPSHINSAAERQDLVEHGGLTHKAETMLREFVKEGEGVDIRVHRGEGFAQIGQRLGLNGEQTTALMRAAAKQSSTVYREAGELRLQQGASIHLDPAQVANILRRA